MTRGPYANALARSDARECGDCDQLPRSPGAADRQALPVAVKAIEAEIPLTNTQFGELTSSFLLRCT